MSKYRSERIAEKSANASEALRKGSVPDRSPLQKLELELVASKKEEKRRRVLEAEDKRLRDGQAEEGTRRTAEAPAADEETGGSRFRRASEALRKETTPPDLEKVEQREQPRSQRTAAVDPRPYHREAEVRDTRQAPRVSTSQQNSQPLSPTGAGDGSLERTASGKYRHRARDAGFAGAAAAMTGVAAADRGKAAHERRKSQLALGGEARSGGVTRAASQKTSTMYEAPTTDRRDRKDGIGGKQQLQTDRMGTGGKKDREAAERFHEPDPVPREKVATAKGVPVNYKIPPQTAAAQNARQQVGFGGDGASPALLPHQEREQQHQREKEHHSRLGGLLHHHHDERRAYHSDGVALEEWRSAGTAKLTAEDLDFDGGAATTSTSAAETKDAAWWEKERAAGRQRSSSSAGNATAAGSRQYDGAYEEEAKHFRPQLFLKCGPLLRYTGMRRESASTEVWRGSVMIVTEDAQSDYKTSVPVLRLFAQPMDLFIPPPKEWVESGQELPPEFEDPVAGQVKLSRTGRPLYVRPVHDIDGSVDLSRVENPTGLYAATRTPVLWPQSTNGPDGRVTKSISFQDKSRIKRRDGEKGGRYREVRGARLHAERGYTFWRFNLAIELGSRSYRVAYRINRGPALGFWVPGKAETMNCMFHSCNGFSLSVDTDSFSGPDPLWRDVLNKHQARPFHVMLGGGDQIYNDAAMRDTVLYRQWAETRNPEHKHKAEFTTEMQDELEGFYLERYCMWFSQGLFAMAGSQIPMVNLWDDHDIIDGFGSYPDRFMSTRVFTGIGAVAYKYYMLFQQQSTSAETEAEEPSWLLGASPGPYINELARSVVLRLGRKMLFLGLDCRMERMKDEICSQATYDRVFDRLRREIAEAGGQVKHLIVLLGVPIAYPRLNFLENVLTSKMMDPIKALGRTGMLGGFVNKMDGGVEVLDDLDDHWTAKGHKAERNWFIQELQELAAETSVRVTILGGDVHLGAVGQFYSRKTLGTAKDRDHRYMTNVISSAIVNTPPPVMMADVLNKRNKVHHLDHETDEDMIPMFGEDVDGSKRNNHHLLPRRNYATIAEYVPGGTPPGSPRLEDAEGMGNGARRFPPGSMKRTMSLTRNPAANLVRRLSGSGKKQGLEGEQGRPFTSQSQDSRPQPGSMQRSNSLGGEAQGSYFNPQDTNGGAQRPSFHRRPTNLSVKAARKAAAKGGADGNLDGREPGQISLENGLDISLNMEIDQRDPGGATMPYRLLVPALWYEGDIDENEAVYKGHKVGFMQRLRGRGKQTGGQEDDGDDYSSRSGSRSPSPPPSAVPPTNRKTLPHANLMPAAGRYPEPFGKDGADGARRNASGPPSQNTAAAPPTASRQGGGGTGPYPQSGYRRSSAPSQSTYAAPQGQQHLREPTNTVANNNNNKETWAPLHSDYSEGSLTPSDEYMEEPQRPQQTRRPSKAERFFGINDEGGLGGWGGRKMAGGGGGGEGGYEDEEGEEGVRKRKGWKIWQK